MNDDCSNCKYHSKEPVPRDVSVSFDEFIETSDETDVSYQCKYPQLEREIGRLPILCDHWEPTTKRTKRDLDAMIEKANERWSKKSDEDR